MVRRDFICCLGTAFAVPFFSLSHPQNRDEQNDFRLEQVLPDILEPRIRLSELFAKIFEVSGVKVIFSGKRTEQASDDIEVCALLKGLTLSSVLEALCSLLSYRGVVWRWYPVKDKNEIFYEVRSPANLTAYINEIKQQIQKEFEEQDEALQAALSMSDSELENAAKTNNTISDMLLARKKGENRQMLGLRAFFDSLSREERLSVLKGKILFLNVKSLPETAKKFIDYRMQSAPNQPYPKSVAFYRSLDTGELTPSLFIEPDSLLGYNFIGGPTNEKAWRDRIGYNWILKEDTDKIAAAKSSSLYDGILKKPEKVKDYPYAEPKRDESLEVLLWKLSECIPGPVLAVLSPTESTSPSKQVIRAQVLPTQEAPYGKQLGELLNSLSQPPLFMDHKWRRGVLLLRNTSLPFQRQ